MKRASIALRMDDVGASSKKYEVYSNSSWRVGPIHISANWLFLKTLARFKAWGPYKELSPQSWESMLRLLQRYRAKLTVAVTAAWADSEFDLKPFPLAFPRQAGLIKEAVRDCLIEVANHGLCHCVLQDNLFKPKLFAGNRQFHREFGQQVAPEVQREHLERSQEILESWLGVKIVTFVPPGNQFTEATLEFAQQSGIEYVSCDTNPGRRQRLLVLGNRKTETFHDRDISLHGIRWFEDLLEQYKDAHFCFVRELSAELGGNGN